MSGTARLIFHQARPNPFSTKDRTLYILRGDATAPAITIETAPGVTLPQGRGHPAKPFHLKVLHFNDLHGWICDIQHQGARPIFSRMVYRIRELRSACARKKDEGLLVVSAGDDIIGTVFDQLLSQDVEGASAHPGYKIYSRAGIDAT